MKYKYYNFWKLKQAINLTNNNPYEAKHKLEEYLDQYPNDYTAYPFYISTLITLRELDEAEKLLNEINNMNIPKTKHTHYKGSIKLFNIHILHAKVKLLSYQEKYEELYRLCIDNESILKAENLNNVLFYARKKHGNLDNNIRDKHSYLFKQITEYKEEEFLKHIQKHFDNIDINNPNKCVFSTSFPTKQILDEIKKIIPSENGLYVDFFDNIYLFKYDNCGKINYTQTDYFAVVCFHNTKDIITMYPTINHERLPSIDLNYLSQEPTTPKVKRLSQTDKFNQKYHRK